MYPGRQGSQPRRCGLVAHFLARRNRHPRHDKLRRTSRPRGRRGGAASQQGSPAQIQPEGHPLRQIHWHARHGLRCGGCGRLRRTPHPRVQRGGLRRGRRGTAHPGPAAGTLPPHQRTQPPCAGRPLAGERPVVLLGKSACAAHRPDHRHRRLRGHRTPRRRTGPRLWHDRHRPHAHPPKPAPLP